MGFYVYRKFYFPQAQNKWQAMDLLREAEEKGIASDFFVSQWAREEDTKSEVIKWAKETWKQLNGK